VALDKLTAKEMGRAKVHGDSPGAATLRPSQSNSMGQREYVQLNQKRFGGRDDG